MEIVLKKEPEELDGFILVNLDVTVYFRVKYEPENWNRIVNQLDSKPTVRIIICEAIV